MAKKFYQFQPNDEVAEASDLSNLTPASIDLTSWQDLTIQDGEESIADKIANDDAHIKADGVATAFTEKTYAAGDFCTYDGKAYVCKLGYTSTAASPDPGNDTTHWTLANLSTQFSSDNTLNNLDRVRTSASDATTAKGYIDGQGKYPITATTTGALLDRTINTAGASVTTFTLPTATTSGAARDLILVIDLSSASAASTITIYPAGSETITPHPEATDTLTFESGKINILSITEITAHNFLYARKAVS